MARGWGKWPAVRFIEWAMRTYGAVPSRHAVKFMELGSGAGAQMRFLAEEGFDVWGLDGSLAGIESAAELLGRRTFGAQYWRQHMEHVDLERPDTWDIGQYDGQFDCIFDVCTLQHLDVDRAADLLGSAITWLKPGGRIFSMWATRGTDIRGDTPAPHLIQADEVPRLFGNGKLALQIGAESVHTFDGQRINHLLIEARKRDGQ